MVLDLLLRILPMLHHQLKYIHPYPRLYLLLARHLVLETVLAVFVH